MKIGLVGEAPNDVMAIQNLLSPEYPGVEFVELLERIDGSMLDNKKSIRMIRREFEIKQPDIVLFIRDLDGHEKDSVKLTERKEIFSYSNNIINKKGIFLLNIYELEALILADIDTFNEEYGCAIERYADPMKIRDPKEVLIAATRSAKKRFDVSHNPNLFSLLNFEVVKSNCRYFSRFIKDFDKRISFVGINAKPSTGLQ